MLTHLYIRNFAIIEEAELELHKGMTVLTGETGAGKSILLDALGLVLGDRAANGQIRDGHEQAEICAGFSIADNPQARQWLADQDMDDNDCIMRRTIRRDGRSRGYINGHITPMQSLRLLGEMLVDIHGQHEHQLLLRGATQRALLDHYAGTQPLLTRLGEVCHDLKIVTGQLNAIQENSRTGGQMDMLQYQLDELEALDLAPEHIAARNEEHRLLSNAGRLLGDCKKTLDNLYESDHAVHGQIARMKEDLHSLSGIDATLQPIADTLNDIIIQCGEAAGELRDYIDRIHADENRLGELEQTLATLHTLSRKHQTPADNLHRIRDTLREQIRSLENADQDRQALQQRQQQLTAQYHITDTELGRMRQAAALALGEAISAHMQELGMDGGQFSILVQRPANARPGPNGSDTITFMVSANQGQSPRPLARVASGGELSRISLALQLVAARYQSSATLIFDEVDSGIGGGVAETVGRQLRQLSAHAQVMCVTHLPQVAAQGTSHFVVSKHSDGRSTTMKVHPLNAGERVEELARMLGGVTITEQSRSHAQEMLHQAN